METAQLDNNVPQGGEQPQPEAKVTFDERQQAKVAEIVAEVKRTTAAAERARVASELEAKTTPQGDDSQLRLKLAETEAERDSLRSSQQEAKILEQLRSAVGEEFVDRELIVKLLREKAKMVDGRVVMLADDGSPAFNASFEVMSPQEAAVALAASKPFLVRSTLRHGVGSTPASVSGLASAAPRLEELFGKHSDSRRANEFALAQPQEYRRLRLQARERGLI